MQLPSGKPAELLNCFGGLQGKQKLARLVSHRRRYHPSVAILVESPQPFVGKADKLPAILPTRSRDVRLYRTRQASLHEEANAARIQVSTAVDSRQSQTVGL